MARKSVKTEIAGRVWKIEVKVGDRVDADDTLLILESMKMEIPVLAPVGGTVVEIGVGPEEMVAEGAVVAAIET